MPKRALTALLVVVLLLAGATVVIASTLIGGDSRAAGHQMPDGSTMDGSDMDMDR